jgi:hypothetical protein
VAATGLGEEMSGRALVSVRGEQEINRLPHLIDSTIEVALVVCYSDSLG